MSVARRLIRADLSSHLVPGDDLVVWAEYASRLYLPTRYGLGIADVVVLVDQYVGAADVLTIKEALGAARRVHADGRLAPFYALLDAGQWERCVFAPEELV